jgi:hypothetical protein
MNFFSFFFFLWDWGLNSGLCTLAVTSPVHFAVVIFEDVSHELFTPAGLNLHPPNLSLPSS